LNSHRLGRTSRERGAQLTLCEDEVVGTDKVVKGVLGQLGDIGGSVRGRDGGSGSQQAEGDLSEHGGESGRQMEWLVSTVVALELEYVYNKMVPGRDLLGDP
jgi:hypothetical protein